MYRTSSLEHHGPRSVSALRALRIVLGTCIRKGFSEAANSGVDNFWTRCDCCLKRE